MNRDLYIAVMETFGQELVRQPKGRQSLLRIFEGLSASGILRCRYANELSPHLVQLIHANDRDVDACHSILGNLKLNGIPSVNGQRHHGDEWGL